MPTMRAKNGVIVRKLRANARRDCFLADIGMASSVDQAALVAARQFFLRMPDDQHCAEETEKFGVRHKKFRRIGESSVHGINIGD